MEEKKSDPHEAQWRKICKENLALTKEKDDIYDYRALACERLLDNFC